MLFHSSHDLRGSNRISNLFLSSSFPRTTTATRPEAYLPAGRHFFKEYPMREDDRPFWQEVREELSPRRNPIGWVCILAILGMFCLVGYFDHPAELHMRPAIIVSK